MTFRSANAPANAALDTLLDATDAGSGPGTVKVYTGSQPETANTAPSGTLLVTFALADPAWAPASARTKTLDADPDLSASAIAGGTAGWARVADSDGNTVFDGSVGTSGAEFIINTTSITSGQTVTLTAGTVSDPA